MNRSRKSTYPRNRSSLRRRLNEGERKRSVSSRRQLQNRLIQTRMNLNRKLSSYRQRLFNLENEIINDRVTQRNRIPLSSQGSPRRQSSSYWTPISTDDWTPIVELSSELPTDSSNEFYSDYIIDPDYGYPDYYDTRGPRTSSPINKYPSVINYNRRNADFPWDDEFDQDLSPIGQEQSRFNYEDSNTGSFRPEYYEPFSEDSSNDNSRWLTDNRGNSSYDDYDSLDAVADDLNDVGFGDELNDAGFGDDDVFE